MIVRLEPITAIILSIILGWGWTELTNDPICEKQIDRSGETYVIPIKCSSIPA